MASQFQDTAESIAREPGLIWKIWTENEAMKEAGGIYLFESRAAAKAYMDMHLPRLKARGLSDIRTRFFDINLELTRITRGPVV